MKAVKTTLEAILPFRRMYLEELHAQSRYHACHERNWSDSYALIIGDQALGYGAVKGLKELGHRDTIFEFYVLPSFRRHSVWLLKTLMTASSATYAECQTNDVYWSGLVFEQAQPLRANYILFGLANPSSLDRPECQLRKRTEEDYIDGIKPGNMGEYVLVKNGHPLGTGGFLRHYNSPYADLYMEVGPAHRQQGLGSYLIRLLIQECLAEGRIPAARCRIDHVASKATLIRGGLKVVGYLLEGRLK